MHFSAKIAFLSKKCYFWVPKTQKIWQILLGKALKMDYFRPVCGRPKHSIALHVQHLGEAVTLPPPPGSARLKCCLKIGKHVRRL